MYTCEYFKPPAYCLYTYCANNPIIYWDPAGHRKVKDILGTEIIESLYNKIPSKEKEKSSNAKGTGNKGYQDSTMKLIMELEGAPFLKPRINDNGTITIAMDMILPKKATLVCLTNI